MHILSLLTIPIIFIQMNHGANRRYIVVNEQVTGVVARQRCNALGSTLATLTDQDDLAAFNSAKDAIPGLDQNFGVWIGLRDDANEGTFLWEDGTQCEFPDTITHEWGMNNGQQGVTCIGKGYSDNSDIPSGEEDVLRWGQMEPNNVGAGEDCVEVYSNRDNVDDNARGGAWFNDHECNNDGVIRYFACNALPTTVTCGNIETCLPGDLATESYVTTQLADYATIQYVNDKITGLSASTTINSSNTTPGLFSIDKDTLIIGLLLVNALVIAMATFMCYSMQKKQSTKYARVKSVYSSEEEQENIRLK
mmetsp:Transcript_8989/g.8086  ORF Transcript_8989/g.8086 Transcript_8989/m.8086 type:complete len:307 (+) Transcript_8989:97-1017(+)